MVWAHHLFGGEHRCSSEPGLCSGGPGPPGNTLDLESKGHKSANVRAVIFLQLNVVTKNNRRFWLHFSPVWKCAKQRADGVRGLPGVVWVLGFLWEQSDLLSHPLPVLPWSSCLTQDICPQCAVRELNCPCMRTFSHENRPPIDLSDRKWLWELGPRISKFMGLCSTSTGLRQTVSLLTLMYLTL